MIDTPTDGLVYLGAEVVIDTQFGSVSMVQRKLRIGFGAASQLMDRLVELGIVAPRRGSMAHEVLVKPEHRAQALDAVTHGRRFNPAAAGTAITVGRGELYQIIDDLLQHCDRGNTNTDYRAGWNAALRAVRGRLT